ncbi:MAG: hypothetical protein M3O91_00805 [Chloroflexota bacterium]|nr:hypothetical protein [Chloroflexota bacterium]
MSHTDDVRSRIDAEGRIAWPRSVLECVQTASCSIRTRVPTRVRMEDRHTRSVARTALKDLDATQT